MIEKLSFYLEDSFKVRVVLVYLADIFDDDYLDLYEDNVIASLIHSFFGVIRSFKNPIKDEYDLKIFKKVVWDNIRDLS